MVDFVFKGGNEGEMNGAINAIDVALWDIKAKIADEPLWQTFGAREGRTKAYASGIDLCLDDDQIFAFYRLMAERGVDSGKLKVGLDMKADLRRIGIMQEALSIANTRPRLLIDSNEYWSAKEAHNPNPTHRARLRHHMGRRTRPAMGFRGTPASIPKHQGRRRHR